MNNENELYGLIELYIKNNNWKELLELCEKYNLQNFKKLLIGTIP